MFRKGGSASRAQSSRFDRSAGGCCVTVRWISPRVWRRYFRMRVVAGKWDRRGVSVKILRTKARETNVAITDIANHTSLRENQMTRSGS